MVIPRNLTLSTRTSSLPEKFGHEAWTSAHLHKGWVGLILCLLWEVKNEVPGLKKWAPYLGDDVHDAA